MFQKKEFEIDTTSAEYKLLHPSEFAEKNAEGAGARGSHRERLPAADDANFDAVHGLNSEDDSAHDDGDDGDDDGDVAAVAGAARQSPGGQWGNTSTKGAGKKGKSKQSKRNQLTMFEVRGGHEAAVLRPVAGESAGEGGGKRAKTVPLGARLTRGDGGAEDALLLGLAQGVLDGALHGLLTGLLALGHRHGQ